MKSQGNYFYVKKPELKSAYTQVPNTLFHLKITATERLVLAYLFSNAETFRITNYRIEKVLRSDFRTIKKALSKLHKLKLIEYKSPKVVIINIEEIERLGTDLDSTMEYENEFAKVDSVDQPDKQEVKILNSNENQDNIKNNCNLTSSTRDNSISTGSKTPGNIPVGLQSSTGNITGNLHVENHSNNNKQEELKEQGKKEASYSFPISEVKIEVEKYLQTTSKYFFDENQVFCSRLYERFRIENPESKLTSIQSFENALYYHLLNCLEADDVIDLNRILSRGKISITLADFSNTIQLIINKKEIYQDYQKKLSQVKSR